MSMSMNKNQKQDSDFESYTLSTWRPSDSFKERLSRMKDSSFVVFPNWDQPTLRAPQGFVMQVSSSNKFMMDAFATQMFIGTTISEISENESEIFANQSKYVEAIENFNLISHTNEMENAPSIYGNQNNMDSKTWNPFWSGPDSYVGLYGAQVMNETTSSWTRKWFIIAHNGLHPSVQKELERYMLDCEMKNKTYGQVFAQEEVMERARSISRRARRRMIKTFADKLGLHVESRDDTHSVKDCVSGYFEFTSNSEKVFDKNVLLESGTLSCNPFEMIEKYQVYFTNIEQVSQSKYRLEFQIKVSSTETEVINSKKLEDFANPIKTLVNTRLSSFDIPNAHLEHICFMSQFSLAKSWIECDLNTFQHNSNNVHFYSDCVSLTQCKGNVVIQRTAQQGPLLLRVNNNKRTSLCGQSWSNQANDAFIGRYKQQNTTKSQQDVGFLNPAMFKTTSKKPVVQETPLNLSVGLDEIEKSLGKNPSLQSSIEFQPFLVRLNQ